MGAVSWQIQTLGRSSVHQRGLLAVLHLPASSVMYVRCPAAASSESQSLASSFDEEGLCRLVRGKRTPGIACREIRGLPREGVIGENHVSHTCGNSRWDPSYWHLYL